MQTSLRSIIFSQPEAKRFSGELLSSEFQLPEVLRAMQVVSNDQLPHEFASVHLRPGDIPLAFHRESPSGLSTSPIVTPTALQDMSSKLERFGQAIQYVFSDGLCIMGHQILYHPHSRLVPRHLLPLLVNVKSDIQDGGYSVDAPVSGHFRPQWQAQTERVIISILLSAIRSLRMRAQGEDDRAPESLLFTFDSDPTKDRRCAHIDSVTLAPQEWGPWRLNTSLPEPQSGVHYGRVRLELDPKSLPDLNGLGRSFLIDVPGRKLTFHLLEDQLARLSFHAPKPTSNPEALKVSEPKEVAHHDALETGLALHLSGHSGIQATALELSEILEKDGRHLSVYPASVEIPSSQIEPNLFLTGDGSFRFITKFPAFDTPWEAHGLPQSCFYALMGLQLGLGATTGYSNSAIAYARKGLKRERDIKVLRHLGFALMIFHDAVSFAMGQRISDGTTVSSKEELLESIYQRIGAMILKSEGWPTQTGSLAEVCSMNVTTLIDGFVSQLILDVSEKGRAVHAYLPKGEVKINGLTRATILFLHAITSDLVSATGGSCFGRARTKYFENFLNGRLMPEREDIVLRQEVDTETAAKMIYQPGINERFLLPETSVPPRCYNIFLLMNHGFRLTIDGKPVESFDATDFRPEFTLKEESAASDVIPLGNQKINWFELHPKFFFKGSEITAEQATRLSKDGMLEFQGRLYRVNSKDLPSLKRLNHFWASIQAPGSGLMRAGRRKTEDTYYQLPRSQTLELLALRASGVKMRGGPKWDEITRFYDSLESERPLVEIPKTFKTQLQPYQHSGVQWLRDLHELGLGGILADDMGLGKTVTTLAFLETLRTEDRMGKVLILVPTSLTYNWLSEGERFAPEIPVSIFSSRAPEAMLDFVQGHRHSAVICTYGLLQENAEFFEQIAWDAVIFDEAQSLKNITTKRTTAARKLRANFKVCLTGTPLENHYGEFYSLFDLIVPGSLGQLPDFREKYVNPVRVLREDVDFLRLKARPLLMRRTKAQVMSQLPPKIESTIKLPFEDEQKKIYRDIATAYNEQIRSQIAVHGEAKMQLQMLTALLRLRQACSDPSAIPGVNYHGEPPKISTLVDALSEITESGASALVFTQFLATFDRIRKALTTEKIQHWDISGADSRLAREKKLRAFTDSSAGSVMLMTLKTGGVGLNLTKASYVFHIEPWWNPAVENQATDRAHRIGQSETVQVYRYIIKESVEEKIEILKDVKSKRFDALFSVSEKENELGPSGTTLSQSDFEYLLG